MKFKQKSLRLFLLTCLFLCIFVVTSISLKLAKASRQAPQPQVILTLGGGVERENFTTQFAQSHSTLPIWVSSGLSRKQASEIFNDAGISPKQVHLDYRATDTVSNFTSLVKDFQQKNYQHVYLITSDFHMPRAKAIAFIVLGSHGIAYTPVPIPSSKASEPKLKVVRDAARAIVWLITGKTGSSFNTKYARMMIEQSEI